MSSSAFHNPPSAHNDLPTSPLSYAAILLNMNTVKIKKEPGLTNDDPEPSHAPAKPKALYSTPVDQFFRKRSRNSGDELHTAGRSRATPRTREKENIPGILLPDRYRPYNDENKNSNHRQRHPTRNGSSSRGRWGWRSPIRNHSPSRGRRGLRSPIRNRSPSRGRRGLRSPIRNRSPSRGRRSWRSPIRNRSPSRGYWGRRSPDGGRRGFRTNCDNFKEETRGLARSREDPGSRVPRSSQPPHRTRSQPRTQNVNENGHPLRTGNVRTGKDIVANGGSSGGAKGNACPAPKGGARPATSNLPKGRAGPAIPNPPKGRAGPAIPNPPKGGVGPATSNLPKGGVGPVTSKKSRARQAASTSLVSKSLRKAAKSRRKKLARRLRNSRLAELNEINSGPMVTNPALPKASPDTGRKEQLPTALPKPLLNTDHKGQLPTALSKVLPRTGGSEQLSTATAPKRYQQALDNGYQGAIPTSSNTENTDTPGSAEAGHAKLQEKSSDLNPVQLAATLRTKLRSGKWCPPILNSLSVGARWRAEERNERRS